MIQVTIELNILLLILLVPCPMPAPCNSRLADASSSCYGHIFFNPPDCNFDKLQPIGSFSCPWKVIPEMISEKLALSNKGKYGKTIGILSENNVLPAMVPLDLFFRSPDAYQSGYKSVILIVSSCNQCKV